MKKRLIWIVLLQAVLLLTIIGKYYWVERTGQPVTLKTAPVDPRDLFYGDYVTLNYEISRINLNQVPHDLGVVDEAEEVYVLLEQKDLDWHEAVGVFRERPEVKDGQAVLKGTVMFEHDGEAFIRYGIERYYVTENTGRKWEDARDQLTYVDLKVSGSGDAVIEELRLEN